MHDPFKITEPTCISFSGGRTSAYMLWRVLQSHGGTLPPEAIVCFANTGKEDEATLKFVQDCGQHWGVDIKWLEYQQDAPKYQVVNYETASRNGEPFEALIIKKSYLPNPVARFCTEELKVKAINRFVKDQGIDDIATMVGVRADEPRRLPKLRARGLHVPLADAGVTQADVQSFWKTQSFDLGLIFRDGVTALGNCDLCFLKGPEQIMGLIKDMPERATWWAKQESAIGATFRSDRATYSQMQQYADDQSDMFNNEGGIECFCGD
jgi:3'-phosphoadenosine 5'-phosphosulfate sulfotransferase (PAPS reductase)/FAD synthetase